MSKRVVVRVDENLLSELREVFPETENLTYSGLVDLLLRKMLRENQNE